MRRGKPHQQIYRPGSGPLKKTNTIEESESDTNIIRHKPVDNLPKSVTKIKSEGSSPREQAGDIEITTRLEEVSFNDDMNRRPKKPDQIRYVPRPIAQAREINSQDINRNTFAHTNGNDKQFLEPNDRLNKKMSHSERYDQRNDWREEAARHKQTDNRGSNNGQPSNWNRPRDSRDNRSEKIQNKPPSGRRHSTVGIEQERFYTLPPRFQKKILEDNNIQPPPTEDIWDGSSITFQKNQNYQMGGPAYYTLPITPGSHHQNINFTSNTLPNKGRGRARFNYEQDVQPPGGGLDNFHLERLKSPSNSRPPTPPTSRPQTPTNMRNNYNDSRRPLRRNEDLAPKNKRDSRDNNQRRDYNYKRDNKNYRDNYNARDQFSSEDAFRDHPKDRNNRDNHNRNGNQRDGYHRDNRHNRNDRNLEGSNAKFENRESRENNQFRDNNKRGGGNQHVDRRRDNRRERGRRSQSKDTKKELTYQNSLSTDVSVEENWDLEETVHTSEKLNIKRDQELHERTESCGTPDDYKSVIPNLINSTLDWSEEVELHDRLESEYFSDALTRSSSIVSLDVNVKPMPPNLNETSSSTTKRRRRNRRKSRNRSRQRDGSNSRTRNNNRTRKNSTTSIDSRDSNFRVPRDPYPGPSRRCSRDTRDSSYERFHSSFRNISRDNSWDRQRGPSTGGENWRDEIERSRRNSEKEGKAILEDLKNLEVSHKKPGVLVLPQQKNETNSTMPSLNTHDQPRYPDIRRSQCQQQKSLYDPNNPNKPIIVKSTSTRVNVPGFSDNSEIIPPQLHVTDQFGNVRPPWYDETTESFKSCHYPELLRDIKKADNELQYIFYAGLLLVRWDTVDNLRSFLKEALEYLVCKGIKFCQIENVEQHFWNILYHNIIEVTREAIKMDPENKEKYKGFLLYLIDEGTKYFESLVSVLEKTYDFKVNNYLKDNPGAYKSKGLISLALVCTQKLFLFLGDLGRYKEEVNETSNYGKCRQWYIKSHEINPKNGKPYNQLALLAVFARRKLDAVYYYMRSLMSSNPVPSAKQNLVSLFHENKKKYDQGEKKRREERLERQRQQMKQKESEETNHIAGQLRRETWIHPEGGRKVYRTTQANLEQNDSDEDLSVLTSVEVNKRFVISYLHVLGKLITKIGMESFHEAAMQMLKEFRALLQHSPVPIPCNRLLQLLALNMYAIDTTQLKDQNMLPGYRSELQERALIISLQMFNLILERCVSILNDYISSNKDIAPSSFPPDANVLLPGVKIWCDWLLCHTGDWNPPPSTQDFKVGTPGDCWSRLATLMNLLEQMDQSQTVNLVKEPQEGYEPIRLPEDNVLNGFTPLMYTSSDTIYAPQDVDIETAYCVQRLNKILFFGTVYLCGVDPPVLKLEIEDDVREYVSVVCASNSRDSPPNTELSLNNDVLLESFSDDNEDKKSEEEEKLTPTSPIASTEVRELLTRKVELEKRKRSQELHKLRVKKILSQAVVSVHVEVRPKYLVPDTNCFIDHIDGIRTIAQSNLYTLRVPIVVLSELEGLSKGGKVPTPDSRSFLDPQHIKKVAEKAKEALDFFKKRPASVKCVTTKGVILASTIFSTEDDTTLDTNLTNDDKILNTCIGLCKGYKEIIQDAGEGEPRHIVREVVLLTDDRNLRVKAYARDVPVRELPDFMRWAGLG